MAGFTQQQAQLAALLQQHRQLSPHPQQQAALPSSLAALVQQQAQQLAALQQANRQQSQQHQQQQAQQLAALQQANRQQSQQHQALPPGLPALLHCDSGSSDDDTSSIDSDGSDDHGDALELGEEEGDEQDDAKYTKPKLPAGYELTAALIRVETGAPGLQAKLAKVLLHADTLDLIGAGLWSKMLLTVPTFVAHIYTTPPMQEEIKGVWSFTVEQLVAAGVPRAVAVQLVPVCTRHTDQLLRAIAKVLEKIRGNLDDLLEVSVTAAAVDREHRTPLPVVLMCQLGPNQFKAFTIQPGETVVFKGAAAFLIPHQLFARKGSYSVRMRYLWLAANILKAVKRMQKKERAAAAAARAAARAAAKRAS